MSGEGAASHGDAPSSRRTRGDIAVATLRRFIDMRIVNCQPCGNGAIVELAPQGRMSRRWVLIVGEFDVTDISDPQLPATYRNRRGITEQQHADIGDDMYEKEREDRQ